MYAIFYSKIVEQVNVVRKYAPIPTDNFSTKLARPNMFKMQNKPAMWVLVFFNVVVAISSKLALSFQVTALLTNISQLVRTTEHCPPVWVFTKDWTRVFDVVDFKNISGFRRPHEFTKPIGSEKKPLWRVVSKVCGFDVRIDWFRVDRRPIPTKKYPDSLMS